MKEENCHLCNPSKSTWNEEGFYGFQCFECSSGRTAFIVLNDHKGQLTEEEKETFKRLCEKHFPDLVSKGLSDNRKYCSHWYEFLIKK